MVKVPFTQNELMAELVGVINQIQQLLDQSLGSNFYLRALGLPCQEDQVLNAPLLTVDDIEDYQIAKETRVLYEYGVNALWCVDWIGVHDALAGFEEFFHELCGVRFCDRNQFSEWVEKLALTHELAAARACLELQEPSDSLTFRQIALLANLDERTVRNAASAKDEAERLKTIKNGGRTYVEHEVALEWLSRRPGFRRAVTIPSLLENNPQNIADAADFGRYIGFRRADLGLSLEDLAGRLGWPIERIPDLAALEAGNNAIKFNDVLPLSAALKVEDPAWLLRTYMRLFYLDELAVLSGQQYEGGSEEKIKFHTTLFRMIEQEKDRDRLFKQVAKNMTKGA